MGKQFPQSPVSFFLTWGLVAVPLTCSILVPGNDHDVRGTGPGSGLAGHSIPLWHGIPGAQHPRAHAIRRVLAKTSPFHNKALRGAVQETLYQVSGGR